MKNKNIISLLATAAASFLVFIISAAYLSTNDKYQEPNAAALNSVNGSGTLIAVVIALVFAFVAYMVISVFVNYLGNKEDIDTAVEQNKNGIIPSSMTSEEDRKLLAVGQESNPTVHIKTSNALIGTLVIVATCLILIIDCVGSVALLLGSLNILHGYGLFIMIPLMGADVLFAISLIVRALMGKNSWIQAAIVVTACKILVPGLVLGNAAFSVITFFVLAVPLTIYIIAYRLAQKP